MKKYMSIILLWMLLSVGYMVSAQGMPDYVIRTAQEINAIYGDGTIDINNTGWDYRGGSIGDNFPLTEGCTSPISLPTSTSATGYYRVFFDTDFDGVDDWKVVVYNDYSYFGLCAAPQYRCGLLEPRLTIGSIGHVDPNGFPNNLRAQPGESGQLTGEIPAGAEFTVVDGPRCGSDISFWLVNYNGTIGWTAEGQGEGYFLNPGVSSTGLDVQPTSAAPTPIAEPTTIPIYTCDGITSRLYVGRMAQVTPGLPNNLRALPGESGEYIGEIPPGIPFEIIGGPQCNSNLQWWQVNYNGTVGWTAEAGSVDDYWLEPVFFGVTRISSGNINLLTSFGTLTSSIGGEPDQLFINARNEVTAIWQNREVIWNPVNPAASIPDITWALRSDRAIDKHVLASRLDSGGLVVNLVRNPANNQLITLESGTFFDEFDLSTNNTTLDIAAFHPDDGDMIIVSQRGLGFILINSNPDSPAYRQVSQAGRVLSPSEIYTQMVFSRNGQRMAALTDAGNIMVWRGSNSNPDTWEAAFPILAAANTSIYDVALNPDGTKLAVAGVREDANGTPIEGFYTIYDLSDTSATEDTTGTVGAGSANAVEFTPDGTMLVVAPSTPTLLFIDSNANNLLRIVNTPREMHHITFNDDATLMATSTNQGIITMWRIN